MIEGRLAYADDLNRIFRQVVGVVLLSWQRVLRVGLITGALALVTTEIVAAIVTSSFPPPAVTHLVAVALALAIGYGVALTMLLGMLLKGSIQFIQHLEGEVEMGAHAASVFARREVDDLGAAFRRIASAGERRVHPGSIAVANRRPTAKPRPAVPARGASAAVAAVGRDVANASIRYPQSATGSVAALPYNAQPDTRRDPDDAIIRAPAPALQSLPVHAAHLPRIEWTYDETSPVTAAASSIARAPQRNAVPTVPVLAAESAPGSETTPPTPLESPTALESSPSDPSGASEESGRTPDVPGLIPRGWYRPDSTTRPLPAITRPLPAADTQPLRAPGGVRSGGLWERVSQALVGQPGTPVSGEEASQDEPLSLGEVMPEDAWLNG